MICSHQVPPEIEQITNRSNCTQKPLGLKIHINDLAILVYSTPQVMLLAIDLYEDLVDEKGITVASVFPFQSTCVNSSELDTPEPDRFVADSDTSLG